MPQEPGLSVEKTTRLQRFLKASQWCGAAVAVIGSGMTLLWALQPTSAVALPSLWLMKANTAVCLAVCGVSLALGDRRRAPGLRRLAPGLALAAGTLGALTLIEYLSGANLRIDNLITRDLEVGLRYPGRMAPQTAIAFVLVATGLLTANRREGFGSYLCDATIILTSMVLHAVMSGYFFHDLSFIGVQGATPMSPQTIGALTVLWLGLVCRRADVGLTQIVSGDGRGSAVIRYLMPPTILAPVVIASVRLWGESGGWLVTPFTSTLFGTIQSMIRIATILTLGYLLNRSEEQRKAEQARREEAERMVAMCAWTRRVRWNGEWMPIDDFLTARFGLEITHGISDEALANELTALGGSDDFDLPKAS